MKITPAPAFYNTGSLYRTRVNQSVSLIDSQKVLFGTGSDASILYNGSKLIIKPDEVGSGGINLDGDTFVSDAHGVILGHTAQIAMRGDTPEFQMLGTGDNDSVLGIARFSADDNGAEIYLAKSRNASVGSFTVVQNGDRVGAIRAMADDGADFSTLIGLIDFKVSDSSPASNDIGGSIGFYTTPGGGGSGAVRMLVGNSGTIFINETANGGMTTGLTVNQGAADDQILAFKSSDIGVAMTGTVEADTYGAFSKRHATQGGLHIEGFSEAERGINLTAYLGSVTTTQNSVSTEAGVNVRVTMTDGSTGVQYPTANANLFGVSRYDGSTTQVVFIVDEDGDLFADGSATTVYDEYDDTALVRAFDLTVNPEKVIRNEWDNFIRYNEKDLVDARLLGDTIERGGLINVTGMQRLHNGAISQIREDMMSLVRVLSPEQRERLSAGTKARLALT